MRHFILAVKGSAGRGVQERRLTNGFRPPLDEGRPSRAFWCGYRRCLLKCASVRSQASFAAAAS